MLQERLKAKVILIHVESLLWSKSLNNIPRMMTKGGKNEHDGVLYEEHGDMIVGIKP